MRSRVRSGQARCPFIVFVTVLVTATPGSAQIRLEPSPNSLSADVAVAQGTQSGREVTVADLQRLALAGNADLLATRQDIAAARGRLTQSRLRPNPGLDFTMGSGRLLGSPGEREIDVGYAHTFELGGKRARRIDVGRVGVEIAELQVADRERRLTGEIKARYAETLAARRNFEILGELYELNQRSYQVAERRISEGEAPAVERALLQVEVGRIGADRVLAGGMAERALAELKLSAGLPMSDVVRPTGSLSIAPAVVTLENAIAQALDARPDLKTARQEEAQADAEVRLTRADRVPDLIGVARYSRVESRFDQFGMTATGQLVPVRDTDHILTAGVSIPLPFANRNQGNIAASTARRQAAALRREFVEQTVRAEVTAAYARYSAARRAVELFDQQVVGQAQESVNTIRTSYDLGELRLLDVLQEQRRLVDTQKAYTDILKEHYVARAALEEAISRELR